MTISLNSDYSFFLSIYLSLALVSPFSIYFVWIESILFVLYWPMALMKSTKALVFIRHHLWCWENGLNLCVCVFFIYLFYVFAFGTDSNQFIIYVVYYLCIVFGAWLHFHAFFAVHFLCVMCIQMVFFCWYNFVWGIHELWVYLIQSN